MGFYEYDEDGNRSLLGIPFPEIRKNFDGKDKEYLSELANTYLALMDKLMEKSANKETYKTWLLSTDFFKAPSSTKYHSAFIGGLLYHSLLVLECLVSKIENNPVWTSTLENTSLNKIVFVALTHDYCKINFYNTYLQNKKVYSDAGTKQDNNGKFDWEAVVCFNVNENFTYGHGEKSVYLIEHHFFRLDKEMAQAIRGHMGFSVEENTVNLFQNIVKQCPLALALSEADQEAAMLYEYFDRPEPSPVGYGMDY